MTSGAMKTACLLLPLLLTPSLAEANGKDIVLADSRSDEIRKGAVIGSQGRHLNADDSIRDLLGHPAFAGFARLLLPWDGRRYDEAMRLSDIGSLLPYHSHVDPETVVGALNRMIDDVNNGHAVFYPFYSEEQKQKQPARENTGSVLLPRKTRCPLRRDIPRRRLLLCRLRPRRVSLCHRDQRQGLQRFRAAISRRLWRRSRHRGSGCSHLLHLPQREGARRRHPGLLPMGKLGRRKDGGCHRFARRCRPWRRHASKTVSGRDGLHSPFRSLVR